MTDMLCLYASQSELPNPEHLQLRLFIHEKGIATHVEEVIYDAPQGGEMHRCPYAAATPWGEAPSLALEDGSYLTNAGAIARYLDQRFPGRKVLGKSDLEQGQDAMWERRIFLHMLDRLMMAINIVHGDPELQFTPPPDAQWSAYYWREALYHAAVMDRQFADGRAWLLGGPKPTFADIALYSAIVVSRLASDQTALDVRFEHLRAFCQRWRDRPAFQAAFGEGQAGQAERIHLAA